MGPLLSIIIPCYNVEGSIAKCVKSILASNFYDFEVLLIDDGSADGTCEIIQKIAKIDSRIRFFTKSNGGPSSARNLGLSFAVGKWITFIDADDYVFPQYIGHFFESETDKKEIKIQGAIRDEKIKKVPLIFKEPKVYNSIEKAFYRGELLHFGYTWGKLYNHSIIYEHSLRFNEKVNYKEDLMFLLQYLKFCDKVTVLPYCDYIYVQTSGSLVSIWHPMDMHQMIYKEISQLIIDLIGEDFSKEIANYVCGYDTICLKEFLNSIYSVGQYNGFERIKYLRWLRQTISPRSYPIKFKSDSLLYKFYKWHMLHIYDICQQCLVKIRKG